MYREPASRYLQARVAGDLLGRERITGAKNTRLGCDSPSERFTNIVEVPALWHTKQSFLRFIWEQLYQPTAVSGREPGTLYNFRQTFKCAIQGDKQLFCLLVSNAFFFKSLFV